MRTLNRNKICIYYANYVGKVPIKDEYGNLTGEYKISYDRPFAFMAMFLLQEENPLLASLVRM